jgi:hypothetical protein
MRRFVFALVFVIPLSGWVNTAAAAESVTINLKAQNNSGENGTATLIPEGTRTKVIINLPHAPTGIAQPAHIHPGTCTNLNPRPKWPLANVIDGKSETVVPVSLSTIQAGTYAINVHKSKERMGIYVSCGNIPLTHAKQEGNVGGY